MDERTLAQCPDVPVQAGQRIQPFTAPGWRVLVVDDNLVNRKVANVFLNACGFDLTDAESGPQAIGLVKGARFDMIFMDNMMPGMDGKRKLGLLRELADAGGEERRREIQEQLRIYEDDRAEELLGQLLQWLDTQCFH